MKNYYCLISIGEVSGIENTLSNIINGTHHHINLGKLFISTFESDFSIWEIEQVLIGDKRSIFLTKMEPTNFTANIQDTKVQNDLFLDFVLKMTNIKPTKEEKEILDIEDITLDDSNKSQTEIPKFDFDLKNNQTIDFDKIDQFLNEIRNNSLKRIKPNKRKINKKNVELPTLDQILDKINKVGYEKLTKFEKKCLENYSKN